MSGPANPPPPNSGDRPAAPYSGSAPGYQPPPPSYPAGPAYSAPGQPSYPGQPPGATAYPTQGMPAPLSSGQGGYAPMPPTDTMAASGKGFFAALFDFSFTTFVTPKIIKVLYLLITIELALAYVVLVIAAFSNSAGAGIGVLIFGAILLLVYLALTRVVLEFYMAVFRISDDVQAIRRRG